MKCINHPEADAAGYCRQCGKGLCAECRRDVRGVVYCEDCLASTVMGTQAAPGAPNPGVALALGFIPGVGAIYNGEYAKGFMFLLIFGGLIGLGDSVRGPMEGVFVMLTLGFYFYMIIDAYRTAKMKAAGQAPTSSGWEGFGFGFGGGERGAPIGPLVLIVLGVLFLMHTLDLFDWQWLNLGRFWPVLLIALGAYMLWRRTTGPTTKE